MQGWPLYITLLLVVSTALFVNTPLLGAKKQNLEGFAVAVVGKEVVTHHDVLERLKMETLFGKPIMDEAKFKNIYQKQRYKQAAEAMVNEARQIQAVARLAIMAKTMHQSKAGFSLLPSEIKKNAEDRVKAFAENNGITLAKLKELLGSSYASFYKQQEARGAFQQFLLAKWGYLIRKNITDQAVAKERKKWEKVRTQKEKQYFVREIVIYDRGGADLAKEKVHEVLTMLNKGHSFVQLVELFSENSLSREKGGMREAQGLEYFEPPVRDFLKNAQDGDISQPIALPTARSPKKWILVLLIRADVVTDQGQKKAPDDDFFRNRLFNIEMERLAAEELVILARTFPCTLNIRQDLNLDGVLGALTASQSDSQADEESSGTASDDVRDDVGTDEATDD